MFLVLIPLSDFLCGSYDPKNLSFRPSYSSELEKWLIHRFISLIWENLPDLTAHTLPSTGMETVIPAIEVSHCGSTTMSTAPLRSEST